MHPTVTKGAVMVRQSVTTSAGTTEPPTIYSRIHERQFNELAPVFTCPIAGSLLSRHFLEGMEPLVGFNQLDFIHANLLPIIISY